MTDTATLSDDTAVSDPRRGDEAARARRIDELTSELRQLVPALTVWSADDLTDPD